MRHEKISDLLEKRSTLLDKMWEATEKSDDNGESLTALRKELRSLDDKIQVVKLQEEADRAEPGIRISGDAKLSSEIRSKFSLLRACAGAAGLNVDAGFEKEIQAELAKRAGKSPQGFFVPTELFDLDGTYGREKRVLTTSTGSELVATVTRPDLYISALTASTIVRSLGATVLDGLVGNLSIPRETDSPATAWVGENAAISADDANFDAVTLSPKHVGALSEYSRNMLMQSSPAVEGIFRQMLARNIGQAIDKAAIRGGGSNEPVGILGGTSGIGTVTGDTDLFTACADAVSVADIANVNASRSFLTDNVVKKIAAKALDKQNRPIGISAVFGNEAVAFSNLVQSDANSPDNRGLIYADWSELFIGTWSILDILVNPFESVAYSKGNVQIRAMASVDIAVRHPASFVSVVGVTSALAAMPT